MKKLLYSLLLINLLFVKVYGDDFNSDGDYTINLNYIKAPSYTVKIPRIVNVTNENTTMNFYVKGDIYADQKLSVIFDSTTTLSSGNKTIPVNIVQTKNSWLCLELTDSFQSSSIVISHNKLSAGTWSGQLNVSISLQGGN